MDSILQNKRIFVANLIIDSICILVILLSFVMLWNTVTYLPEVIGVHVPAAELTIASIACIAFFLLAILLYRYLTQKRIHENKWTGLILLGLISLSRVYL